MAFSALNRNPSPADLRTFGRLLGPFVGVAGGIVALRTGSLRTAVAVWCLGGLVTLAYLALPAARRPLFVGWTSVTYPIGWAVSHAVMAVVYFGVVTPIGFLVRRFGGDPLERDLEPAVTSYWVEREPEPPVERYFRQF